MSTRAVTEEERRLELYRVYALLEKEKNLFLLLEEFRQSVQLDARTIQQIEAVLAMQGDIDSDLDMSEAKGFKPERQEILKSRSNLLQDLSENLDKTSDLYLIVDDLKETDEILNKIKASDEKLSEEIEIYRLNVRKKDNLKKAFSALMPRRAGGVVGLADVSYVSYVTSGNAGGGGGGAATSPILQQLNSIAQVLLAAHVVLIAQALYGAVSIINFMRTELYAAKRLQKSISALTSIKNAGRLLRLKKSILVVALFVIRAVILGVSIGLTAAALLTPVGSAILLMVALVTYLFEELKKLSLDRKDLIKRLSEKEILEKSIQGLNEKIVELKISVPERLKFIEQLQEERQKLGRTEGAVTVLKNQVMLSVGTRNRTIYNAIGATLIIASALFPPLFFLGVSMLVVPIVIGIARYADEKLNKGRITQAIANSAVVNFITDSKPYKWAFGDKLVEHEEKTAKHQERIKLDNLSGVDDPLKEAETPDLQAEKLLNMDKFKTVRLSLSNNPHSNNVSEQRSDARFTSHRRKSKLNKNTDNKGPAQQ